MRRPKRAKIGMRAGRMAARGFRPTVGKDGRDIEERDDSRGRRGTGSRGFGHRR